MFACSTARLYGRYRHTTRCWLFSLTLLLALVRMFARVSVRFPINLCFALIVLICAINARYTIYSRLSSLTNVFVFHCGCVEWSPCERSKCFSDLRVKLWVSSFIITILNYNYRIGNT